ncbi:MAG: DUF2384 domain-containing protein [Candidatus Rokubacteria bacterium]|nr:DUF2384 domain-containing protein [Candidatus Rokubacteria bacterium]
MKVALVQHLPKISRQLEAAGHEVHEVSLGPRARTRAGQFHVVVMSGAAARGTRARIAKLKATFPDTPCVLASDRLTGKAAADAIAAGALLTTIRSVPKTLAALARLVPPALPGLRGYVAPELHDPQTGRLDAGRVASALGLSLSALAKPIGVTPSALSRRPTARAAQPGLREIEFVWAALRTEFGSDQAARAWLNAPHPDLAGRAPITLLTEGSATALADYLRSALAGQPS